MKLHIELWVQEKGYSTNVKKLFSESVICYRNGAYRASLIFSYLGFLTIIKETVIKTHPPTSFTEPEWKDLIAKMDKDELWEKEVFEALIREKKPIFQINEDLKLQLRYWKDRRNDCAHFKSNEIESHHSEAFWSFIKSNISKLTVEGGMESLLNKFEDHFDETKTPPDSDYSHLVREIENSVMPSEMPTFFKKLKIRIEGRYSFTSDSDAIKVYNKILDISNTRTQELLIEYLKDTETDTAFLNVFPNKVINLNYSPSEIRTLWKTRIFLRKFHINPFNIYSGLLQNNLIPKGEIVEANEEIFNHFNQSEYHRLPEKKDIDTLKANGFFDTVYQISIIEKDLKNYLWVNSKCDLIISMIENLPLKTETVKTICEMAERSNPSQWLIRELNNTFTNMPDLKKDFKSIAKTNGITIPKELK